MGVTCASCAARRRHFLPFSSSLFISHTLSLSLFLFPSHSLLSPEITATADCRRCTPSRVRRWKYLTRARRDASHLLFMSFIYSTGTTKLNFPRFLVGKSARAEYDVIKNKTVSVALGARSPGINPFSFSRTYRSAFRVLPCSK